MARAFARDELEPNAPALGRGEILSVAVIREVAALAAWAASMCGKMSGAAA